MKLMLLRKKMHAVDIAFWGRMLTSSPAHDIEALSIAHAISVTSSGIGG
jgi:hypothetical protein